MNIIDEHIKRVNDKLQQLLKQYQQLQRENARLTQELERGKLQEQELHEKNQLLQQQLEIARVANGYDKADAAVKGDLEKRINAYLKEIDECIALLANH